MVFVQPRCITKPYLLRIGRSVAGILRLFDFSKWRQSAILDFKNRQTLLTVVVRGEVQHCAKFSQKGVG